MKNNDTERKSTVRFLLGINRDGIPSFYVFAPANLLPGVDGKGVRCCPQTASPSGVAFNLKRARALTLNLRIIGVLLRLKWHELWAPQRALCKTGSTLAFSESLRVHDFPLEGTIEVEVF